MKYKGYTAHIQFDDEAETFHGEVADVNASITFQADNAHDLKEIFKESIDDYLDWRSERQIEADKPPPSLLRTPIDGF